MIPVTPLSDLAARLLHYTLKIRSMKSLFILAATCLLFAACSSNNNENNTPAPTGTTSPTTLATDTPQPVPMPDTTGPLNKRSGAIQGRRTDQPSETRADSRTARSGSRSSSPATITTTTTASAGTTRDGDVIVVKKGQEENAMREKIHENNSIDGGGQ